MSNRMGIRQRSRRTAAAALIVASIATAPQARATDAAPFVSVPGQILVRFSPRVAPESRTATHRALGATLLKRIPAIGYDLVAAPASVLSRYRARADVVVAEPNYTGRIALSPSDACHVEPCPGAPGQWHLRLTNTAFGWDAFPGTTFTAAEKIALSPVTIAVLDTKIDATHPDFANPGGTTDAATGGQLDLANARDWVPASKQTGSAAYHGTFVAGLAGAAAGNGRDVAGVGYAARLLPLTVVDGGGTTDA
ncbi:MAG TPA: S8 family serine peptidase, partial [Actinomycetota bacterium]|nr:S8 family serine peptidase [Actinomycetota bacterium]